MPSRLTARARRRVIQILVASGVLVLLFRAAPIREPILGAVDALGDAALRHGPYGMAAFFLLAVLSSLLLPLGMAPFTPSAVSAWGAVTTFLLLFFGWLTGAILAYVLGRYAGYPIVKPLIPWKTVNAWQDRLSDKTRFTLAFFLRLALPAEIAYVYGVMRYPFGLHVLITILIEIPFAVILVFASEAFLTDDWWRIVIAAAVAAILIIGGLRLATRAKE